VKASGQRRVRKQSGGLFSRRRRKDGGTKRRVWCKVHLGARDFDRQVAELQIHVAVLNGYTALGIPVTKVAA
jgi:hypothetical protein